MRPLMRLWEIEVSLIVLFVSVVPFFLCLVFCVQICLGEHNVFGVGVVVSSSLGCLLCCLRLRLPQFS